MITVEFERNESHPARQKHVEYTFSWVQITYNTLVVAPNGNEFAWFNGKYWVTVADNELWSDIIIGGC